MDLFQQQGVLDQTAPWEIQEVPQVELPAERRLLTEAQKMLHPFLVFLLVQQRFGPHLVAAVRDIGLQAGELWRREDGERLRQRHNPTRLGQRRVGPLRCTHPVQQGGPHLADRLLRSSQALEATEQIWSKTRRVEISETMYNNTQYNQTVCVVTHFLLRLVRVQTKRRTAEAEMASSSS